MLTPQPKSTAFSRWIVALGVAALTVGFASSAFGQDSSDKSGGDDNAKAEKTSSTSADSASSEAGGSGDEEKKAKGPDRDDPHYWAKVREIHTVQKRYLQKVGRFSASVYGGVIPNNIFERYYPVGLRLDYFILENIGIEVAGARAFKAPTSLEGVMDEDAGVNSKAVRVADSQVWHTNFGLLWSPFYGKTSFYENKIGYFDMYLFGGAGLVVTKTPDVANQPEDEVPSYVKPEGVLGAGLAFYAINNATVRLDYRQFIFQKVSGVGGVANPSEVSLGFGWFF